MSPVRRKAKKPLLGQATIAALRKLDSASREGSFEDLAAQLLAQLIGQPVRRARAGSQHGKDALSNDSAIAIECKRYAEDTPLRARELVSELEQAKTRHPDLQLWVLATTTALGATEKEELDEAAHRKGLAVLHLDTAATAPYLEETHAIAALCAADIEAALKFLSTTGSKGAIRKLRDELEAIRSAPGFREWEEWLREEIRKRLPVWRFVLGRQNLLLAKRIQETADTSFGTHYHADKAIRRQARTQLDDWFQEALAVQSPGLPPIAVVLGERYDGKTWLVYQWLLEIAERSPVPIFLVGSGQGIQSDRGLTELQIEDLAPALKRERAYAGSFVNNYRSQDVGKTPWALVVLDGLNEYAPNHQAWRRHLDTALGRGELDSRPAAVLVTVRARSWDELKHLLPRREISTNAIEIPEQDLRLETHEVPLGPFSEEELQEALVRLRLPQDFLGSLSQSARELAHRPRYLGLIAQYRQQLGDYAAVTPEVLHWLDLRDKVGRMRPGREDWGTPQYQGFLKRLAKQWIDQRFLDEAGIRSLLGDLTTEIPNVLAELRSEGVLTGESGNYTVQSDRLTMGYGLFLRDSLVQASRQSRALQEVLRDVLAPMTGGDDTVDALRAASTLMLMELAAQPLTSESSRESVEILDTLLWEWLDSRNLGTQDLQAIHDLRKLLFDFLLRSWREIWSKPRRNSRIREIAVMVFGEEAESESPRRERLRVAVQEWFRMVPRRGGWYQREQVKAELKLGEDNQAAVEEAVASLLQDRMGLPNLAPLNFQIVEGIDVLRLQTVGLYLVSRAPGLVQPEDLLSLLVGHFLLEEPIDSGDAWVVRRAAEHVSAEWFEREALRCADEPDSLLGQALRELIRIAGRADLAGLKERIWGTKRQAASSLWPIRRNYKALLQRTLKLPSRVEHFAEGMKELACDPSLPQPAEDQKRYLARAIGKIISERIRAGDSLQDFEELLPVIAAWAPDFGVKLIGEFLCGLPALVQKGTRTFLLELKGQTVLVRGRARMALQDALRLSRRRAEDWRVLQQRELTLALLPASNLAETVTLLTAKEEKSEHKETFNLAGFLRTDTERRALTNSLIAAKTPRQKRRLRFLLARAGRATLPAAEILAINRTLMTREQLDITAALDLANRWKVIGIAPELLFPISRGEIAAKTLAPEYASELLVQQHSHERIKDHLDDYWRAQSAMRKPENAKAFLDEISASLAEYKTHQGGITHAWESYDLPAEIRIYLDRKRVEEWTQAFDSWDGAGWRFWGGLIRPTFEWCLRNAADEPARTLWPQISPFQRRRFGGGSRFTIDGVDSVIHALNRPEADDDLARYFLTELILDTRTDLEILEISLGALLRGSHRLRDLARELSAAPEAEKRARAVAIFGWLAEDKARLEALRKGDPSIWVRKQAGIALERHALNSWAKGWIEQFLTAKAVARRWAAGQLFLECADRRIDAWAWKRIREAGLQMRVKGEAILLLQAAQERAKKKSDQLKSTLLGYEVNALSTVAHPWRRDDEWILDHYGRRD
jgi:hypothetical protein